MKDSHNDLDMPMGLGMALAKNLTALNNFSKMDKNKKQAIIEHTHSINSKKEMQAFVQDIADGKTFM